MVRGQLGVIGEDGVFADDGRFHALPLDYLEGPFPCAPLDARGHAFAGMFIDGAPASGQLAEESCSAPGRRVTLPQEPTCPAQDERLVMAGMAGPLARTVTYADPSGHLHTVAAVGPQGAYLIVQRAPAKLGLEGGEYEPGGPGAGTDPQDHVCQRAGLPDRTGTGPHCSRVSTGGRTADLPAGRDGRERAGPSVGPVARPSRASA